VSERIHASRQKLSKGLPATAKSGADRTFCRRPVAKIGKKGTPLTQRRPMIGEERGG